MKVITVLPNYYIYNGIYLNERVKAFFIEFSKIYNSIYDEYINKHETKIAELEDEITTTGEEFDKKCMELSSNGMDIYLQKNNISNLVMRSGEIMHKVEYKRGMSFSDFIFGSCSFNEESIKELDVYLEKAKRTNTPCIFLPKSIEREYNTYLEVHKKLDMDVKKASEEAEEFKKKHIFATEGTSKKYKTLIDNYRFANETLWDYETKNETTYETGMSFQKLTYEELLLLKETHTLFEKFASLVSKKDSENANMKQKLYEIFKRAGEESVEKMINSDSKWFDEIEYAKTQLFKIHLKKCLKENDEPAVEYEENLGFNTKAVESFITLKKEEIDSLGYILLGKIDEGILNESKENGKVLSKKINGSDSV